jgi:hypothetical protein
MFIKSTPAPLLLRRRALLGEGAGHEVHRQPDDRPHDRRAHPHDHFSPGANQGCQIFLGTIYQNAGKYTKLQKMFKMTVKIYQMAVKPISSIAIPSKIYTNCYFGLKIYYLATLVSILQSKNCLTKRVDVIYDHNFLRFFPIFC